MSGIVTLSNGQMWKVSGPGWRALFEPALKLVPPGPLRRTLEEALYLQDMDLSTIADDAERKDAACALLRSAQSLVQEYTETDMYPSMRDWLMELIWLLQTELGLEGGD